MLSWQFDIRNDGSAQGWEDTNVKHFKASPFKSLAKEIIQNSLDAAQTVNGVTEKVILKFELLKLPSENIPGIDEIKSRLAFCAKDLKDFSNKPHANSINKAIEKLSEDKIDVLKVEEVSGTIGMYGPANKPGTPFHTYLKGSGKSSKHSDSSLGSQGTGKGAAINVSDVNTIFVTTNYEDNNIGEKKSLIQGRSTLSSHWKRENDGKLTNEVVNNVGYFGGKDFSAFEFNKFENPTKFEWLKKNSIGTDIYIVGFRDNRQWFKHIMPSVLMSFFAAIQNEKLEVIIQHPIDKTEEWKRHIKSSNLNKMFEDTVFQKILKENNSDVTLNDFKNSKQLWKTLKTPKEKFKKFIDGIGELTFYVGETSEDTLNNKHNIGLIRKNMFITNFGDRNSAIMRRIPPKYLSSNIIIEAPSKKTSNFFVEMEPPDHNKIERELIDDDDRRKQADKSLKLLQNELFKILDEHFSEESVEPENIDIFDDWLAIEGDKFESKDFDPTSGIRFNIREKKSGEVKLKRKTKTIENFEEDFESEQNEEFGGPGDKPRPSPNPIGPENPYNPGSGSIPIPDPATIPESMKSRRRNASKKNIQLLDPRIVLSNNLAKIYFTSTKTCRLELVISKYGADLLGEVKILKVNHELAKVTEFGTVELNVNKNERISIDTELDNDNLNSIKLTANRI